MPSDSQKGPKYHAIAREIRDDIEQGRLKPGDRVLSYAELRDRFGVMPATAHRIFEELEKDRLIVRGRGRGGTVVATPPTVRKTSTIALNFHLDNAEGSDYGARLMQGAQNAALRYGLDKLWFAPGEPIAWEKVDGVVAHIPGVPAWPPLLPVINVMTSLPDIPCVVADDCAGARLAVQHLLELGHRRIGCLFWLERYSTMLRHAGYLQALSAAGIVPRLEWTRAMSYQDGATTQYEQALFNMRRWLADGFSATGCTALLANNDLCAFGAMRALQDAGLRIPEDISVVGFDGTSMAACWQPSLTTVAVPLKQIAETAVDQLVRCINGERVPNATTVFPTELRLGESTASAKKHM